MRSRTKKVTEPEVKPDYVRVSVTPTCRVLVIEYVVPSDNRDQDPLCSALEMLRTVGAAEVVDEFDAVGGLDDVYEVLIQRRAE